MALSSTAFSDMIAKVFEIDRDAPVFTRPAIRVGRGEEDER